MATDLDKAEAGLLLAAAAVVAYLVYKASHVVSDAAHSLKEGIGPPVGTDPTTACNGGPCPDDYLARQPWWQKLMGTLGIGQATPAADNSPAAPSSGLGPPVGTDPTTACNGGPCPDDALASWLNSNPEGSPSP
jgi:hypothetical protein